jgi:NADPH:quinone reductase-like Zn-dependent oxidoreductase
MKAIAQDRYGSPDVLELREIEKPDVTDDGVLVRVHAASVNALDWHMMRGEPFLVRLSEGLRRPRFAVRGSDMSGIVEAVGGSVTQFRPGDEVWGAGNGAFAEYVRARERNLVSKPAKLTFEHAATVPTAAVTALQGLRDKGGLQAGHKVLINGASGGVGHFAVQIARALGAEVTGVCSTRNVEMVRSLGADRVVDYSRDDFTRLDERYDLIFDIAGTRSLLSCRRALTSDGKLVVVGGPGGRWLAPADRMLKGLVLSRFVSQRFLPFRAQFRHEDLLLLDELIEGGKVTPVIDRTYPLSETADAIRYLETMRARGKVVITV